MSPGFGDPLKVFISYSHDSPKHMKRVRLLSDKLREEGVDCTIDQYVMSPSEGWPRWMQNRIEEAHFVLVVCTEVYYERVRGISADSRGLGAIWEGQLITQELYESAGRNLKFIPVIFTEKDVSFIPSFLRSVTRYNLEDNRDYKKLYRHLTNQPSVLVPKLGEIKKLMPEQLTAATVNESSSIQLQEDFENLELLVLLISPDGIMQFISSKSYQLDNQLHLVLLPRNPEQSAFLLKIKDDRQPVGVAYGDTALLANVKSVTQKREAGIEEWIVTMIPENIEYGGGSMEMSTSTFSADQLAEMRARRILLDEKLKGAGANDLRRMNDTLLDYFVGGQSTPIHVEKSPFPELYIHFGSNGALFLSVARLVGIYFLRLSGVIEYIFRLDLSLSGKHVLHIDFEGQRARKYVNADPYIIKIEGDCILKKQQTENGVKYK